MTLEEMRERKRALGYSNEILAERSGVPLATVQKVLSGITKNPIQAALSAPPTTISRYGSSVPNTPAFSCDSVIITPNCFLYTNASCITCCFEQIYLTKTRIN